MDPVAMTASVGEKAHAVTYLEHDTYMIITLSKPYTPQLTVLSRMGQRCLPLVLVQRVQQNRVVLKTPQTSTSLSVSQYSIHTIDNNVEFIFVPR